MIKRQEKIRKRTKMAMFETNDASRLVADSSAYTFIHHPLSSISETHDNDILLGRGGRSYQHPGNKKFRNLVSTYKVQYEQASKRPEKASIANEIVNRLRYEQSPPGRFLTFNLESHDWQDVGDVKARSKVSQALREKSSSSALRYESPPTLEEESIHTPSAKRIKSSPAIWEEDGAAELKELSDVTWFGDLQAMPPSEIFVDASQMDTVSILSTDCLEDEDFALEDDFDAQTEMLWHEDVARICSVPLSLTDANSLSGRHQAVSFEGDESISIDVHDVSSLPYATMSLSSVDFEKMFDTEHSLIMSGDEPHSIVDQIPIQTSPSFDEIERN